MADQIIKAAIRNFGRKAISTINGDYTFVVRSNTHTRPTTTNRYGAILEASLHLKTTLQSTIRNEKHPRIAVMCPPGPHYVAATWAAWLQRGVAVPLCLDHPDKELQYVLEDAGCSSVLATDDYMKRMEQLAKPFSSLEVVPVSTNQHHSNNNNDVEIQSTTTRLLEDIQPSDPSLIVYTSGTTGRPKGAVHTHSSISAQIEALVAAWEWTKEDRILHSLPLHHIHGIVNALYCALSVGATVEMLPKFSPTAAWQAFMRQSDPVTVFMGVPTMYSFLINHYQTKMDTATQLHASSAASKLRLAVSGSAAAPIPLLNSWKAISGKYPLERYGMTETGMILGNPLHGERRPGCVGIPFPGVDIKIVSSEEEDGENKENGDSNGSGKNTAVIGELCVKSRQLFSGYWNRPEATKESFDSQGYFKTGDTATYQGTPPYVKLLGRTSVDIIKRGGFKISALGIESVLLNHPDIAECAVVGIEDKDYGEAIAAVVALKEQHSTRPSELTLEALRQWAKDLLPTYQLPDVLKIVDKIPRNAMGKINKKSLVAELFR